MICKRSCIRRMGACAACLVLIINLVCTSYTRVEAAPVAGYAIEEIVAALLVSLGITGATGEALDKAGLTGTDATKILNSIYANTKGLSYDTATNEAINQTIMGAIANATETGKIIFKEGSKAWDAVKDWAKTAYNNIKTLTRDNTKITDQGEVIYSSVVKNVNSVTYPDAGQWGKLWRGEVEQAKAVVKSVLGVYPGDDNQVFNVLIMGSCLVTIFAMESGSLGILVFQKQDSMGYPGEDGLLAISRLLMNGKITSDCEWTELSVENGVLVSRDHINDGIGVDGARVLWSNYTVAGTTWLDGVTLPSVLNPSLDSAYDIVYNPTVDDFLDIATPTNTITREKDGTRTIAGDRTIDVARPIAWPVDLTKGIVIGKDIPIENVLDNTKTDEKTDEKTDPVKPSKPNLPTTVGDGLMVDLKSIFPFCIPFDLIDCIKGLSAEGEAPKWVMKIPMPTGYTWTITVDMADYDSVVRIFRLGEDLLFIVGLIMITRSLMIRG